MIAATIDAGVAVVVERNEVERLAQVDVASPVEPRLLRILIPREIEVKVAHGTQDDLIPTIGKSIGEVLGAITGDVVPDVGAPAARGEVGVRDVGLVPVALGL